MLLGAKLHAALLLGPALGHSDGNIKTVSSAKMEDLVDGLTNDCPDMLES